ncbi:MAG TPA: AsmA family protein [Terriglobia bacterium]|nr:AsmA family protein [Terriglobia bacterium]
MSTGRKISLAIACMVIAFMVAAVFVGPRLVQLNQYRSDVVSYIEQQTGRRVEIGRLALSIVPVIAIRVDHFAIGSAPGFPAGNWLVVRRIDARLDFSALLHGQIVIRALKLEQPVLDLFSDQQGHWNFQIGPPRGPVQIPPDDPPPFIIQGIIKLTLDQGDIAARELQPNRQAGPSVWNASGLSLNLGRISAAELNAVSGAAPPTLTSSPSATSRELSSSTTGELHIRLLRVSNLEATQVETSVQVSPSEVRLGSLHFRFYGGQGQGAISLLLGAPAPHYQAQIQLAGVEIAGVLAQFPSARGQMTGTLSGQATFSGSGHNSEGQQGQGALMVHQGTWPKLELEPNLVQLLKLAKLGSSSANLARFSLISADWRLAAGVITVTKLHIADQGAVVDSSGTVDLMRDGRLDFQGDLRMPARQNALSNLLAGITGGRFHGNTIDVPFVVNGTAKKPALGLRATAHSGSPF